MNMSALIDTLIRREGNVTSHPAARSAAKLALLRFSGARTW